MRSRRIAGVGLVERLPHPPTLPVSEVFGPTWQGEGPTTGQLAAFLRLGRCNLSCTWCDTAYTWDATRVDLDTELRMMRPRDVTREVLAIPAPMVVITGGEPLLHQAALAGLVAACRAAGRRVEMETNGTIAPTGPIVAGVDQFNVSPKLANSGLPGDRRIRPAALRAFLDGGKAVFKFVAETPTDLLEIADLQEAFALAPIWVMPEGLSAVEVMAGMRVLADPILAHGWNLSTRLQALLWEGQRGR